MKFLVDAQLPIRLVRALEAAGHDARHTTDLPHGNRSTDRELAEAADAEDRVVITKDADFRDSHLLAAALTRVGLRCGRRERGQNAAGPSASYRRTNSCTQRREIAYSRATSLIDLPATRTAVMTTLAMDIAHLL